MINIEGMKVEEDKWTLPNGEIVGVGDAEICLRREVERAHLRLMECMGELARYYEANRMWHRAYVWVQALMTCDDNAMRHARYQHRLAYLCHHAGRGILAGECSPDDLACRMMNVRSVDRVWGVPKTWDEFGIPTWKERFAPRPVRGSGRYRGYQGRLRPAARHQIRLITRARSARSSSSKLPAAGAAMREVA